MLRAHGFGCSTTCFTDCSVSDSADPVTDSTGRSASLTTNLTTADPHTRIHTDRNRRCPMQIDIICVGKVKEQYLRDAIAEYSKRLGRYCKLNILEVADEKTPEHASEGVERQIKAKEGERIAKHIKPGAYVIALAIDGQQVTSEGFARKIDQLGIQGVSHIQFVIGGSIGMDDAILRQANYKLSFSKMTFPHQLMRVILLEQVYRAYKINAHEPYHK